MFAEQMNQKLHQLGLILYQSAGQIDFSLNSSLFQILKATCSLWLREPSLHLYKQKCSIFPSLLPLFLSFLTLSPLIVKLLPPSYKVPLDYIGPSKIIQDNFLISRSLIYLYLESTFCCIRTCIHKFQGLGC